MSTHSNGGEAWSTKLNRIRKLAEKDRSQVFNNLGHLINFEFLCDCFNLLDGRKAVGIDGMTKDDFAQELTANLSDIIQRIRRGTYKPQPARQVMIPKEDGSKRPLAISCVGDKIVETAVARILETIFEPIFLDSSYEYRPGRNAHMAIQKLYALAGRNRYGALIEIDIRNFFNTISHDLLSEMMEKKIRDRRFLRLLCTMIKQPVEKESGEIDSTNLGIGQGSILSPILANIYLHFVIDEWVDHLDKEFFKGRANVVRFADDMVFTFERQDEAKAFFAVLPKRLEKFGLKLNTEKSSYQPCGQVSIERVLAKNDPSPKFKFLGFVFYWSKSVKGFYRLKCKTRPDRFRSKLKEVKEYLRRNLNHDDHNMVIRRVGVVVRGWINYYAVTDNAPLVWAFHTCVSRHLHRWFNRRGKKGCMNYTTLKAILIRNNYPMRWKITSLFPKSNLNKTNPVFGSVVR